MRKLPGQLLRIALALHVIECYHEPGRPRHELQVDTLNRAVDVCRYYRSTFEVVQESASDSDSVSSILLKIWDMAATSPTGLVVRDAYRSIKALSRRAKELGRNVAAYTIDLYYELEKQGKGSVHKAGRIVRFVAGGRVPPDSPPASDNTTNPPDSPDGTEGVTVVTVDETVDRHGLEVSPPELVSLVTQQDLEQVNTVTGEVGETQTSRIGLDTLISMENIIRGNRPSDELEASPGEEMLTEVEQTDCGSITHSVVATTKPSSDDETQLLSQSEIQSWLDRIATVHNATDCMDCLEALHQLPQSATEYIWSSAETLLPRFWEMAEIEVTDQAHQKSGVGEGSQVPPIQMAESGFSINITPGVESEQKSGVGFAPKASPIQLDLPCDSFSIITPGAESDQKSGVGEGSQVSPIQQTKQCESGDRITTQPGVEKPANHISAKVKDLITGLWVRTVDGLYGHLGAKVPDGRWWVVSPKSRNSDAQSRLYAAADIIPMPAS
jgi:hypothetical protein